MAVRQGHDGGQHVICLDFKEARTTGCEEGIEEIERPRAMLR